MRLIEIGQRPLVKQVYPDETTYICISVTPLKSEDDGAFNFSLTRLPQITKLITDPDVDAIIVDRASNRAVEGVTSYLRLTANRRVLQRGIPIVRIKGDRILRLPTNAPVIVRDLSDAPSISRSVLWLWHRADAVFKRELPLDRWQLFMNTVHPNLPTTRFRKKPFYRDLVAKVRPISLSLMPGQEEKIGEFNVEKTSDVFFAGTGQFSSTVRDAGLAEIEALRDAGVVVDSPEGKLPQPEFYERCARARLVWSPQGFGHDCYRHYEVAITGSVPLISRPPIEQYARFIEGETAFYYDPEPGGLTSAVLRVLERRDELAAMGQAARAHYFKHHSLKARVDHMLASVGAKAD